MIRLMKWENSSISESFLPSASQTIYQGTALKKVKDGTTGNITWTVYGSADLTGATGGGALPVEGLALDSNQIQPIVNTSGPTIGDGHDFPNFNRGGYIAAVQKNALLEVFNGPLDTAIVHAESYTVGNVIYWTPGSAYFTGTAASGVAVGILEDYLTDSTGTVVRLKIRLTL
jgi:hypothetical protein